MKLFPESAVTTVAVSTTGRERSFTTSGTSVPLIVRVMRKVRELCPVKTSAELQARLDVSDRWAKKLLSERAKLSGEQLVALLRSDEGLEILEAALGENPPAWWRRYKRVQSIAALRRAQAEQQKTLERLEQSVD